MSRTNIQARTLGRQALMVAEALTAQGVPPFLARIYAARGIQGAGELDYSLGRLIPPQAMRGIDEAAQILADAIEASARLLIVADYDCDGATACAVGIRALRAFGAEVDFMVPDRFTLGYGLTPQIVALAARREPDVLITVDNGIASVDGVAAARAAGMTTIITDHHLPAEVLPEADVIVNPNQPGCDFPSKSIAGVGVIFYTMMALRAELRRRGFFADRSEPNLAALLDLVALGTVADVVALDYNNRILVDQGLKRMRKGQMQPGIRALFAASGRDASRASAFDLGFALGPRLNAAGRLTHMQRGIECLITDDMATALNIAQELDRLNRERRTIEQEMQLDAAEKVQAITVGETVGVSLYDAQWHQGVIGILAGRLRDQTHRPVFAFAPGNDGELKGSGRSIRGVHLRDALDLVSKREPDLLLRFGGHAMAAGVTIREPDFPRFERAFAEVLDSLTDPAMLRQTVETDGALEGSAMTLRSAQLLDQGIWGQGFSAPLFDDVFDVRMQRVLKEKHLKLQLGKNGQNYEAIQFNFSDAAAGCVRAVYRLDCNEYQGVERLQLMIEHLESA